VLNACQQTKSNGSAPSLPHEGTSIMLSMPPSTAPQATAQQSHVNRGGNPALRSHPTHRRTRSSLAEVGGKSVRRGNAACTKSQWHPPSSALQQVLLPSIQSIYARVLCTCCVPCGFRCGRIISHEAPMLMAHHGGFNGQLPLESKIIILLLQ
jgi:hypothetical protein